MLIRRRPPALKLSLAALASAGFLGSTLPAAAQDTSEPLAYQGVLGDIVQDSTPNPGKTHVAGGISLTTADFFRGIEDNEPKDLDELRAGADLIAIFELWEREGQFLSEINLTLGTTNGIWTDVPDEFEPIDSDVENWYESDNYVGLTARVGRNWLGGLTYTYYSSPNDVAGDAEEIAFTGAYTGRGLFGFAFGQVNLTPQVKVAVPIDAGDGIFTQVRVTPELGLFQGGTTPISLTLPITLGVGWNDYYGGDSDTTGYAGVGLNAALPITAIPSDYGNWTLSAGVDLLLREEDLQDVDREDDDLVVLGGIRLGFTY